MQMDNQDVLG